MINLSELKLPTELADVSLVLIERQRELEAEMASLGADAVRARVTKDEQGGQGSNTPGGSFMLRVVIEPLAEAIAAFQVEMGTAKRGRKHRAGLYLEGVDPSVAAFITARRVLDNIALRKELGATALDIGQGMEDEARLRKFDEEAAGLLAVISKDLDRRNASEEWRRTVLVHAMNRHEIAWKAWPQVDRLHVGQKLIDLLIRSTGIVHISTRNKARTEKVSLIEATPETLEVMVKRNDRAAFLSPAFMPTVVPPKRWTTPHNGGYYFTPRRLDLVKTHNRNYLEELRNRVGDMPALYDAINAIQSTPWKINKAVLEVFGQVLDNSLPLGKLPSLTEAPMPQCPRCLGAVDSQKKDHLCFADPDVLRDWRRQASKVHEKNHKRVSKLMQVGRVRQLGDKFVDEAAIYFPMQYDFRGRVYAMPMFLNPQGADFAKGLLTFASGKPIMDERAAGWLMIHGANLFGYDKVSLEKRIEWVTEHTDEILRVATDPLLHSWWSDADKPWQFLAFCFDYAAFQAEGYGYVSSLPVALDGSCNGLQHFSAMLRDPIGGAAVNLIPSDKPNDIYQEVCNVVIEKLRKIAVPHFVTEGILDQLTIDSTQSIARQWLGLNPDRKLTKRPVMVLPYGGTIFSCREYVRAWLIEQPVNPWGDEDFIAVGFMSKLIWESIGEVVIAARQAMDWLQKVARIAGAEGLPINWTTPDGFPVLQAYPEIESRRVKTQMGDSVVKLSLAEETGKIDRRRQANGISPNYVHSMDATALRLYVCTAKDNGIENFSVVHDSFGTVAADTDLSVACLREAFVSMYLNENHLETFKENIIAMLPEDKLADVPLVPRMGSLDLELVRQADYFFA